jgi:hypothetical protein
VTRLLPLALAACIEYVPRGKEPIPPGVYNPPPPEASVVTDTIVQVSIPEVDVLWIIDNSCSMDDEQEELVDNYGAFLDFFLGSGLDYHIGVVSTDAGEGGRLQESNGLRWIDEDTPNPAGVFAGMALLGTGGDGCEQGLGTSYLALEFQELNEGFLREASSLHSVVISDEADQSGISVDESVGWYGGLRPTEDRSFSAIASWFPTADCVASGNNYHDVVAGVGGISWGIDEGGWPLVLEQLGIRAAGLRQEYFLSHVPRPETLDVSVETVEGVTMAYQQGPDYTYDPTRNSITFAGDIYPPPLSSVVVRYETVSGFDAAETVSD